jgi:cytochrome c oxidase assembly protein subunit 15
MLFHKQFEPSKIIIICLESFLCVIKPSSDNFAAAMQMQNSKANKAVVTWLCIGVFMIIIQVLLGGITRLTGSGLSITEWKPILGAIPPTTEAAWQEAFDKYQKIGQYKFLNTHFTLSDFKFIYFWEWLHRDWGRLIGVVFAIGFFYLLAKKYLKKEMLIPLLILFLLGGLQGAIGWLMVKSGLNEENLYVNHIRLAIHFLAALGLLVYTLWFAFRLRVPGHEKVLAPALKKLTVWVLVILILQLIYGAFMAGLKAATAATTWPTINGDWLPTNFSSFGERTYSGLQQFTDHPIAVQFIHRTLAYLLTVLIIVWWIRAKKIAGGNWFKNTLHLPLIVVGIQVLLGILTVLNASSSKALLWLGVAHQFTAMLLLMIITWMLYILRAEKV